MLHVSAELRVFRLKRIRGAWSSCWATRWRAKQLLLYRSPLWGQAMGLEEAACWLLREADWYEQHPTVAVRSPVLAMKSRHVVDELERLPGAGAAGAGQGGGRGMII